MHWSDIPFKPERTTLRHFAWLWLVFFGGLAAWRYGHGGAKLTVGLLVGSALVVGILGSIKPQVVRPIFVGWMMLAFPVGWLMSRLALALVFYGLFTPVGLFWRLRGRDVLDLRGPDRDTYWQDKIGGQDVRSYLHQS